MYQYPKLKKIISYWIRLQDLANKDPDPTKWKLPSKNNQLFASLGQAAWRAGHGVQACGACSGPSLSSAVLLTHTHSAPLSSLKTREQSNLFSQCGRARAGRKRDIFESRPELVWRWKRKNKFWTLFSSFVPTLITGKFKHKSLKINEFFDFFLVVRRAECC